MKDKAPFQTVGHWQFKLWTSAAVELNFDGHMKLMEELCKEI